MNTKGFPRLGVPLDEATRRATDFVAKFILGGGDKSRPHEEVDAIVANPRQNGCYPVFRRKMLAPFKFVPENGAPHEATGV